MLYLSLAVICSVLVSVVLKVAGRRQLDVAQMVTWNYLVAATLTAVVLQPPLDALRAPHAPWLSLLALAVALPSIFLVLGRAVAVAGIVRSDVAQRLSLLLSLAAAFLFFGQTATPWKLAGLALGLLAMVAISLRPRGPVVASSPGGWGWLLGVWAGFAVVDVLLKQVALSGTPSMAAVLASFSVAFVLMLVLQLWRHASGRSRLAWRNLGAGSLLGLLNGGNILFYVHAHQSMPDSPATVFAGMNIGVVVLGALVGVFAFGEATTKWNRAGLALAVLAIGLIAWG
ncbi:EamA/RhaT family transporter [Stenotrophomonas maltophilia]|uniref:EamA family transporter n=1 Tax=Stenotrophomonas maltophilia TaxID=40324 RepID=UPI0012AF1955|nr:EamA/RhaT family transporter [Stenotrophomonas maltophilia]ELC7367408.1 EamA/RhaT family transporter [Stenotrophomonas maltophilia]MBA0253045.1 EamA/RhaT family transporter [Stenotrophomonas maltophilia]MBA0319589.1 EamA/RhaT family transporter [Stenotrophomonas maltophilia]MBH1632925.1 EamA/RhaT family transporter [Stenotrophomonas maltophilia]MCU1143220.1 EamA/RhaT family transporter [Stenotrophomonas maltophilia]